MICRLCLNHPEGVLEIFRDNGEIVEGEVVNIVEKHFHIQIKFNDSVSNKICYVCWRYLNEFHKFWRNIKDKQQTLKNDLDCTQFKCEEFVTADNAYQKTSSTFGAKTIMCEPELNIDDIKGELDITIQEFDDDVGMNDDSPLLPLQASEVKQPTELDEHQSIAEVLKGLRSLEVQVRNSDEGNQRVVKRLTNEIITLQTDVRELKKLLHVESDTTLLPSQPYCSLVDFEEFDAKLSADDEVQAAFKKVIQRLGGNAAPGFLKMAIKSIISDELAMNLTWRGTADKPSIQKYNTFTVIKVINTAEICMHCGRAQDEFKKLKETVQSQNAVVLETLASQTALIRNLVRQESISSSARSYFPLKNQEELHNLNSKINDENFEAYVTIIKSLIRNQIKKHIRNVLAESLIVDFNLDGTHGKSRLKDFKAFYNTLREAVDSDDPDRTIRQSLQLVKKRHFQSVSAFNKKLNKVAE